MKVTPKALWLGVVLGLVAVLIGVRIMFRNEAAWGALFAIVILVFVGFLIALPVAEEITEKLFSKLYGLTKGKVRKDYSRARWLLSQGRSAEAILEFRRAMGENPEDIALRLEVAEIYARELRDYPKAIQEYEACLGMNLQDAAATSILNRIADTYESGLGDRDKAVHTLRRITAMFPGTKLSERARERMEAMERSASSPGDGPRGL